MLIQQFIEARQQADISQRQLSAVLGRPYTFVQKVESLERQLNPIELMQCCEAIGVDFIQFLIDFKAKLSKSKESESAS